MANVKTLDHIENNLINTRCRSKVKRQNKIKTITTDLTIVSNTMIAMRSELAQIIGNKK